MKKSKSNINLGLQLLRFLLCFWIVIVHLTTIKKQHKKYMHRGFHIPSFILLAFYFYYPILQNQNISKITIRFQRLTIPYIFWPTLIFILHNTSIKTFRLKYFQPKLPINYLYLQLLLGTPYYQIFWFQFNLIFLSLFFR